MMDKRHTLLILTLLLAGCGGGTTVAELPTAHIMRPTAAPTSLRHTPTTIPPPTPRPEVAPTAVPPVARPTPATPLDQYRAWMEEARTVHPYGEPIEIMWEVMICESSGEADQVAGSYYGLFQYEPATWSGDWNPYRDSPILEPRAQIFATAKAWHDGNQHWWGCYR